ncbi:choice-of-anchor Q domain-containing protein [Telluribacter humicola]|uniref:choice-of-anchor Q domain-containing protein n=1 Tax=Telluribacter humicola TaxID=1720261 RepID=UPI001A95AC0B|nr:choice-of-anchor Q domain-containing protein [Telluribacter humicola]
MFAGNYGPGGALYNSQSTPILTNVTIVGNGGERAASLNTRESHLTIRNSIIWGNQGQTLDQNATISNSIVEGGYVGTGNLNVNPRFVQPVVYDQAPTLAGDYRLQSSSAAIDAGDNTVTSGEVDLDGNARRYNGGVVDMGAYEYQGSRTGSGMVISIRTGNWEDPSTWDVGRVPAAGDQVVLDQNHTVSVNGTATAQTIEYRQNATLLFLGTSSMINLGQ